MMTEMSFYNVTNPGSQAEHSFVTTVSAVISNICDQVMVLGWDMLHNYAVMITLSFGFCPG